MQGVQKDDLPRLQREWAGVSDEALKQFKEGLDSTLFLEFRERCKYMLEKRVPNIAVLHECSHPGNRFAGAKKDAGLPNCFLAACPIFEKLKDAPGYQQLFDGFCERLEGIGQT